MARSSIGNDIEVTGSPAPSQSNTINLTDDDPDSPAPSTPGTSESQEATTSKKRKTSERSLTSDVWSHFVKETQGQAPTYLHPPFFQFPNIKSSFLHFL
ncbi:hypothetical protein PSHT_11419 [Puccinia striiformis]|uniref:Uncharacterized protein n=2 Tax=Puccinia striiformis TaxID=27350 RepID=A0A2S4UTW9_9BASI|nr:hypothetical protein PSTT_12971 [Puccinia striiformis]POW04193.1 hypothetical protein PSHT_11419 [Puccinia striiformis]